MRAASSLSPSACAVLLGLLLALRLLGATGYMPSVERGTPTIIVCPDADADAPLALDPAHHSHHHSNHSHPLCPYAAASALGALGADWPPLLAIALFGSALLLWRAPPSAAQAKWRARPPSRAPPLTA